MTVAASKEYQAFRRNVSLQRVLMLFDFLFHLDSNFGFWLLDIATFIFWILLQIFFFFFLLPSSMKRSLSTMWTRRRCGSTMILAQRRSRARLCASPVPVAAQSATSSRSTGSDLKDIVSLRQDTLLFPFFPLSFFKIVKMYCLCRWSILTIGRTIPGARDSRNSLTTLDLTGSLICFLSFLSS